MAFQPGGAQHRLRLAAPLGPAHPGIEQRQGDVVERAHPLEQVEALEHETDGTVADGGQLVAGQGGDIAPGQHIAAAAGHVEAAQDVHEGGLARTGRPHDGDELARLDGKVDAVQHRHLTPTGAIALAQLFDPDQRRHQNKRNWKALPFLSWLGASSRTITASPGFSSPPFTSVKLPSLAPGLILTGTGLPWTSL